jgi:hypothetical protein
MFFSSESTMVSTEMMAKIPIVTPKSERIVRKRLDFNAFAAKTKLSKSWRTVYITAFNEG